MNSYCLNNKEYSEFLSLFFHNEEILDDGFREKIERATIYWDLNLIGSNCFLSMIFEKIMKRERVTVDDIEKIYDLTNNCYFTIDQLEIELIDDLFRNHLPEQRNEVISELIEAKRANDFEKEKLLESKLKKTFEKDLINVLEKYYARQN